MPAMPVLSRRSITGRWSVSSKNSVSSKFRERFCLKNKLENEMIEEEILCCPLASIYMQICAQISTCTRVHFEHMYTHTYTYTQTQTDTCMHARTRVHMYTHIHTHKHTEKKNRTMYQDRKYKSGFYSIVFRFTWETVKNKMFRLHST